MNFGSIPQIRLEMEKISDYELIKNLAHYLDSYVRLPELSLCGNPEDDRSFAALQVLEFARNWLSSHPETFSIVPEPVAWLYKDEPSFDGVKWKETWKATCSKQVAKFLAKPDDPIPLFTQRS